MNDLGLSRHFETSTVHTSHHFSPRFSSDVESVKSPRKYQRSVLIHQPTVVINLIIPSFGSSECWVLLFFQSVFPPNHVDLRHMFLLTRWSGFAPLFRLWKIFDVGYPFLPDRFSSEISDTLTRILPWIYGPDGFWVS
jgi:hypothetical protein